MTARRRAHIALVAVLLALVASACRVRTDVGIEVNEDGSGSVTIALGLDDDAVSKVPNLDQSLRLDDLRATGWEVTGPVKEADGFTYLRVKKRFANPEEAAQIFREISGDAGPFRGFAITRERSFARTTLGFTGTVDFSGGLASFSDNELATQLDGQPLGEELAAIEQRIGDTLDRVFQFRVAVRLPGDVQSNAPGRAENGAVWEPKLSEQGPVQLNASGKKWRVGTLALTGVALLAALLLVLWLLIRLALRSQDRRHARHAAAS